MTELKILNEEGKNSFLRYLNELKKENWNYDFEMKDEYTTDATEKIDKKILIDEERKFENKIELGKYLHSKFSNLGAEKNKLSTIHGLWNWLSCEWFDQLCPIGDDGTRNVKEKVKYVYQSRNYHRHIILSSWTIYDMYKKYSKVILYNPLHQYGDMHEQLAAKQDVITNKGLIEAAYILYWNEEDDKIKTGVTNRDGNVRRLKKVSYQLDMTYDLHAMSGEEIISLLPEEFDHWL
ncbi:MAG: hypothetical protein ACOCRX_05280 [Candidatus Woesearchaeota archaeon]